MNPSLENRIEYIPPMPPNLSPRFRNKNAFPTISSVSLNRSSTTQAVTPTPSAASLSIAFSCPARKVGSNRIPDSGMAGSRTFAVSCEGGRMDKRLAGMGCAGYFFTLLIAVSFLIELWWCRGASFSLFMLPLSVFRRLFMWWEEACKGGSMRTRGECCDLITKERSSFFRVSDLLNSADSCFSYSLFLFLLRAIGLAVEEDAGRGLEILVRGRLGVRNIKVVPIIGQCANSWTFGICGGWFSSLSECCRIFWILRGKGGRKRAGDQVASLIVDGWFLGISSVLFSRDDSMEHNYEEG